jgi:hypothetical protein
VVIGFYKTQTVCVGMLLSSSWNPYAHTSCIRDVPSINYFLFFLFLSNFFLYIVRHLVFSFSFFVFCPFLFTFFYLVFRRCSYDKYFIQIMIKSYIEKLYFLHTHGELMHQSCVRNFLITFT